MNKRAQVIVDLANEAGVSIASVCRAGGVTRSWFEEFKKRTPLSVEAYLRMIEYLDERKAEASSRSVP